jgi:hypothetical protein
MSWTSIVDGRATERTRENFEFLESPVYHVGDLINMLDITNKINRLQLVTARRASEMGAWDKGEARDTEGDIFAYKQSLAFS